MRSCFDPRGLSDFARYHGFHYDSLDPAALTREILVDMERGLEGLSSSLPMLPSYLTGAGGARAGKTVLALDAGGTNLRASLVRFDDEGRAAAEGTQRRAIPGASGRASAAEFFDAIACAAIPLLESAARIDGIGFTFSYPMDMQPDADGVLREFSKEIDAPEVIGKAIGAGLREALARRGRAYDGPIALLNDTAATLLSGIAATPAGDFGAGGNSQGAPSPVIGFVLGTGFNTAHPETRIPKIGFESREAPQIVVCETGAFRLRYRGPLDLEFDAGTKNPGAYSLEKTIAGAYIGPLTMLILKRAARDGVLRLGRLDEFLGLQGVDSKTLNEFLLDPRAAGNPISSLFGEGETGAIASARYLASIVAERAATFAACVLAAAVERVGGEHDPQAPVRIAVEGTTYASYAGMRRSVEARLHALLSREMPRPYEIATVDQASLFGAATAAAMMG